MTANHFLETLRRAKQEKWCVRLGCTTCGSTDFRSTLHKIGAGPLADALANMNLDELVSLPDWDDALLIAMVDLPLPGQIEYPLEFWLPRAEENIRFFDVVLYRLVRHLSKDSRVRALWITKGIALSVQSMDFSLVESLLLTLRDEAVQHAELVRVGKLYAAQSKQMRRVLRNACSIDTDPLSRHV